MTGAISQNMLFCWQFQLGYIISHSDKHTLHASEEFFPSAKGFYRVQKKQLAQITYSQCFSSGYQAFHSIIFLKAEMFIGLISTHRDENEEHFENMKYQQF